MPLALVVCESPVAEPPPEATANVTETPGTTLPYWSVTLADGAVVRFVFTVADWPSPVLIASAAGASTVPAPWKVTVVNPLTEAVSVLSPTAVPSFQEPAVAMPLALVVALPPVSEPPPEATAKVTATPETGFPN